MEQESSYLACSWWNKKSQQKGRQLCVCCFMIALRRLGSPLPCCSQGKTELGTKVNTLSSLKWTFPFLIPMGTSLHYTSAHLPPHARAYLNTLFTGTSLELEAMGISLVLGFTKGNPALEPNVKFYSSFLSFHPSGWHCSKQWCLRLGEEWCK